MRRTCAKQSVALCFCNINEIMKRAKLRVMCDIAILRIMKRAKLKVMCDIIILRIMKREKLKIIEKDAPHMRETKCRVVFLQY